MQNLHQYKRMIYMIDGPFIRLVKETLDQCMHAFENFANLMIITGK